MKINVTDTIAFPRDHAFTTYRDKLASLVTYLPNVEKIEVLEREELANGDTRLLNLWKASATDIPSLLRAFVKPEMLQWKDYAVWHNGEFTCSWRSEIGFLKGAINVEGKNRFEAVGDHSMKIVISGDISVNAKKIPGVPGLLAGKIGPAVEGFVVKLITPNLQEVNRGLARYLKDHG